MSLYMVHRNQRKLSRITNGLCLCYAHQKGTYKSRAIGYPNGIKIIPGYLCFLHRLCNYLIYFLNMLSGCNFRHHASIQGMEINLRRNHIGFYFSAIDNNSRCCLIARALYGKYGNIFFSLFHILIFFLIAIWVSLEKG